MELILPADQRLRFFLKYRQLVLFRKTSSGYTYVNDVVLQDDDDTRKKAKIYLNGSGEIEIGEYTGTFPPTGYQQPAELFFDDNENSFWNDLQGDEDEPIVVVGTGDLRNRTVSDMDDFLLTLAIPPATEPIIIEFVSEYELKLYAKSPFQ